MHSDILLTNRDIGGNDSTWRIHFAPLKEVAWTQELFMHTPHYTLDGVHLQNTLWQYDPNRRLPWPNLNRDQRDCTDDRRTSTKSNRRILHFNMGPNNFLLQQSEWHDLIAKHLQSKTNRNLRILKNKMLKWAIQ